MPQERTTLVRNTRPYLALTYSPDGKFLAATQQGGTIQIWDTATKAEWFSSQPRDPSNNRFINVINTLAFSPDGRTLAWGGGDKTVTLLDVEAKRIKSTISGHGDEIRALAFHPDGNYLATGTSLREGLVRLWNLRTHQAKVLFDERKSVHAKREQPEIGSLAFAPTGKTLAVGIFDSLILLNLDAPNDSICVTGYSTVVSKLTFSPDKKVLVGSTIRATLWKPDSGKELGRLPPGSERNSGAACLAFAPTCELLAVGSGTPVMHPGEIRVWDWVKSREVCRFTCHTDAVTGVAWSPDGKTLASSSRDGTVKLWDVPTLLRDAAVP